MKIISEFNNWKNFNEYLSELTNSGEQKAGDIFENLCKHYLLTAPHYRSKLKNVWLLKEITDEVRVLLNLPDTDEGIDLIAETKRENFGLYRQNIDLIFKQL